MADTNTYKGNKRQSLLMPRGTLVGASTSRIASPTKQQRPMSMIGSLDDPTRTIAPRMPLSGVEEGSMSSSHAPANSISYGVPRPTTKTASDASKSSSGIARASSLRKPTIGGLGHARQQSVTKHMTPVAESTSRSMNGSRIAQARPNTDTLSNANPSKIKPGLTGPVRTTIPRAGHNRAGSTATSVQSGFVESQTITTSRLQRPASMLVAPSNRPAFSTLQQHYSPLKARGPKPVSSTLIHPPVIETPNAVSLETSFLQTHLLQLSLLHSSFHPNYSEWYASTRHVMRRKFAEVAARAEIIQEQERGIRGRSNLEALEIWGGGRDGALGENIQTLATVIQDIDILCDENGGKVASMIQGFEGWLDAVRELWSLRAQVEDNDDAETAMEFVDGLGAAWRQDISVLLRRIGGLRSVIDGVEKPPTDSTAAEVIECVHAILHGAIEELELMSKIEKLVGEQEKAWVDGRLDRVIAELNLEPTNDDNYIAEASS